MEANLQTANQEELPVMETCSAQESEEAQINVTDDRRVNPEETSPLSSRKAGSNYENKDPMETDLVSEPDHPATGPLASTEPVNALEIVNGGIIMDSYHVPSTGGLDNSQRACDPDQASDDGSETDEAENPEDDLPLEDESLLGNVVTLVVEVDSTQTGTSAAEETSTTSDSRINDNNTLGRSQRKHRSNKRGYEDDSDDDCREVRYKVAVRKEYSEQGEVKNQEKDEENLISKVLKPKNKADQNEPYICDICHRLYPTHNQYKTHLRTHSEQKPHQCVFCPKKFRQKCQKDKHERIHTGSKPYKCRHCDQSFSESGSRNRHERIHSGYKPYYCQHCDRRFIQKGNKDAHEKTHRSYKPFKCFNENCNDTFVSAEELEQHRNGHPQRPYKCHFCCKAFPFNAERKRHERCHTGVRPYKCIYCDKTFTQKGNKDNHEKTHTGEKPHSCRFCMKRFIRKQYLGKHIMTKHPKEFAHEQHQEALEQPAAVYAVLEVGPELEKGERLAAESLLKAARMFASSSLAAEQIGQVMAGVNQVAIVEHNGVQHQLQVVNTNGENLTNVYEGEIVVGESSQNQIGQVMAELNQQLSEHQVAIVEHNGVQLQVVNSCNPGAESSQNQRNVMGEIVVGENNQVLDVIGGQIVHEHQVIDIENDQVIVGEPEVTVSNEEQESVEHGVIQNGRINSHLERHVLNEDQGMIYNGVNQDGGIVDHMETQVSSGMLIVIPNGEKGSIQNGTTQGDHPAVVGTHVQNDNQRSGMTNPSADMETQVIPAEMLDPNQLTEGGMVPVMEQERLSERNVGDQQHIMVIHGGQLAVHAGIPPNITDIQITEGDIGDHISRIRKEQERTEENGNEYNDGSQDGQPEIRIQFDRDGKQLVIHGHEIVIQSPQVSE